MNKLVVAFVAGSIMASGTTQLLSPPAVECKVSSEVQSMAATLQTVVVEQTSTLKKNLETILNQCSK